MYIAFFYLLRLVRKDSKQKDRLIWRGSAVKADADDFSSHNRETALQLVMVHYPKMVLNHNLYTIR